jgi:hypothetical protein
MTDYTLNGVHPLRRVIWALLKSELGWNESNYGGAVPVVTPQQQPELNAGNHPYVVYNYTQQPGDQQYWLKEEQATFVIYSGDEEDIRKAINVLNRYLSMYDESANYVNWWVQDNGTASHKRFTYKWIRVVNSIGAGPAEEEGGRQDGVITLRYQFTNTDLLVRPSNDRYRPPA